MTLDQSFKSYSSALAEYVNHPDYYNGRWAIRCTVIATGQVGRRVFDSHSDATAFVGDLVARGVCTPGDGKYRIRFERVDPLPGFPKSLEQS